MVVMVPKRTMKNIIQLEFNLKNAINPVHGHTMDFQYHKKLAANKKAEIPIAHDPKFRENRNEINLSSFCFSHRGSVGLGVSTVLDGVEVSSWVIRCFAFVYRCISRGWHNPFDFIYVVFVCNIDRMS